MCLRDGELSLAEYRRRRKIFIIAIYIKSSSDGNADLLQIKLSHLLIIVYKSWTLCIVILFPSPRGKMIFSSLFPIIYVWTPTRIAHVAILVENSEAADMYSTYLSKSQDDIPIFFSCSTQ